MKVFRSVVLTAPIAVVWKTVRDFGGVVHWTPAVSAARLESGRATEVGSVRRLEIADGSFFRDMLLADSDLEHYYSYDILEGPLPCTDYLSTHRFLPITDGDQTLGTWEGEFNCAPPTKRSSMPSSVIECTGMASGPFSDALS